MSHGEPQIIHESEVQRQHPRVNLPGRALVNGEECGLRDISAGGLRLHHPKNHVETRTFRLGSALDAFVFYGCACQRIDCVCRGTGAGDK